MRGLFDPVNAGCQIAGLARQVHKVTGPQRLLRQRQRETDAIARNTRLAQPPLNRLTTFRSRQQERHFAFRHCVSFLVRQNRLLGDVPVVAVSLDESQADTAGHIGLRTARLNHLGTQVVVQSQLRRFQRPRRRSFAVAEHEHTVPFDGVESEGEHERLQRPPRIGDIGHEIAPHEPMKGADVIIPQPGAVADLGHHRCERSPRNPSVEPMTPAVIRPVGPHLLHVGKPRIGPSIPGPDKDPPHVDHRTTVEIRHRVMRRLGPIAQKCPQVLMLDQLVPQPIGIGRQCTFRALGIEELVGLVRGLVHCGAADLGEPDRLGAGYPGRRR